MLLRSVMEHVRTQNWIAVFLDFIIVVVGVYIGIQVSNWNDERLERGNASLAIERLQEDFELILAQTERSIKRHENYIQSAYRLINGIRTGNFEENSLASDLPLSSEFGVPSGPSATYAELVSSGKISFIKNSDLRRKLKSYDDYVVLVRTDYNVFTNSLIRTRDILMRAQTLEITGIPEPDLVQNTEAFEVDVELLSSDPSMHTQLQITYAVQNNIYAILVRNRDAIIEILEMIKEEKKA